MIAFCNKEVSLNKYVMMNLKKNFKITIDEAKAKLEFSDLMSIVYKILLQLVNKKLASQK